MTLIKTTVELAARIPARLTLDMDDLQPVLRQAELEYLSEQILGPTLYEELETAYQADALSTAQSALLPLVQDAIAPLATYQYNGLGNIQMTSGGNAVGSTDTLRPANEWRTRDFERAALRLGYRALDVLIGYLVANATAYPSWADSPFRQEMEKGFIRSTQEFDRHVRIGNSGWLFQQVLPAVRTAETGTIADTFCDKTYVADLVAKITAGTLSSAEAELVQLARSAAAHLAMADSIVQLSLGVDVRGVWTFGSLIGGETSGGPTAANEARLNNRAEHHRTLANTYLDRLRKTLQAQAEADETHPYRSTSCYVDPTAEQGERFKTDGPVGSFM